MTELDGRLFCMFNFQPVKDNKYSSYLELALDTVEPCISGPKRYRCVPHPTLWFLKLPWCLVNVIKY